MFTVSNFDAELYLRMAGERALLGGADPDDGADGSPLLEAARALVAVGAVESDLAQDIVDDYGMAAALRHQNHFHRSPRTGPSGEPPEPRLKPRRVVRLGRVLERDEGMLELRSVSFAEESTIVSVVFRALPKPGSPRRGFMIHAGGGPPNVTIGDDQGRSESASFSGGGSDHEWRGHLATEEPLAADTAWIEVDGERIELVDEVRAAEIRLEALDDDDPALAHLWRRLAIPSHFHQPPESLESAIEALVAAGVLAADTPALSDVRAVLEALQHRGMWQAPSGRRLPEPWRSLFRRANRGDGPVGTIVSGAVTPPFDGLAVAVESLESNRESFEAAVEVAPGGGMSAHFDQSVDSSALAWWARDDCGNTYLGHIGSWSRGGDSSEGTIDFSPALDPKATRLDLMPTARTTRAVISVLLEWEDKT
jgi:hypothetical protein